MSNWRKQITDKFKLQTSSFIFVEDYDALLNEEQILNDIIAMGYEVIRYEDSISFRYLYEQKYRNKEKTYRLLVYANEDIFLPYEFISKALTIKIDIQTIFPKFSAKVMRTMDREDFDDLFQLHHRYQGPPTERDTLNFIVRNFYKVPYEIIDSEAELYKSLLSIHYANREIPEQIKDFLYDKWKDVFAFKNLPLKKLINSSTAFYRYIEEKWQAFVMDVSRHKEGQVNDTISTEYYHPLADRDVRRMMNDLFMEGILKRVKGINVSSLPEWMRPGVQVSENEEENLEEKMSHLSNEITTMLSSAKRYKDWLFLIEYIAELKNVSIKLDENVENLLTEVNRMFYDWMLTHYHSLTSLPPFPQPKLVHHIPQAINKDRRPDEKIALIVLDGMSYPQWTIVREHLKENGFYFEEHGVFAWVPTLTSVSRQAIFSGKMPLTFSRTITTTAQEEKWWKSFWEEHGVLKQYVTYQKALGKETYNKSNIKGIVRKSTKVFGAVVDLIDQLSHHAVLGEKSVMSNLQLWLESDYLVNLLTDLKNSGFTIYLTSDHGNTAATGIGRISEGVLVDQRGERVRIYRNRILYEDSAKNISSVKWSNIGLPEDYYVLLARVGEAFAPKGQTVITHGGISIEEVIVPFAKVID